jgi:hypothetical protein
VNQAGYSQRNIQSTTGSLSSSGFGLDGKFAEYRTTFNYPLDVNNTYGLNATGLNISATMNRGLELSSSGGLGVSTYTLTSGPVNLETQQWGTAMYESNGGNSSSWGETYDRFSETSGGTTYTRYVHAVNSTVVQDQESP